MWEHQGSESRPLGEKPAQPHSVGGMGLGACPRPQGRRTEPLFLSCQHSHTCAHTGHQVGSREHLLCECPWGPISVGTEHCADVPGPPPTCPSSPGRLGTVGPENCSSRQILGSEHWHLAGERVVPGFSAVSQTVRMRPTDSREGRRGSQGGQHLRT